MAEKTSCNLLFFRHAIERKQFDGHFAFKLLKPPFESRSSGSSGDWEGVQKYELSLRPPKAQSLIVGRFPKQAWMSLQFLGGALQQVLEANQRVGRLEFLRIGRNTNRRICSIEVVKKGASLLKWEMQNDKSWQISGPDVMHEWQNLETVDEVVSAIRQHYGFDSLLRTLSVSDSTNEYTVINEQGRKLKPFVCVAAHISGPRPVDNVKATESLQDAIEQGNPQGVRDAIASGASLENMMNSTMSPLQFALYRAERPEGIACAQALIDCNASINGLLANCFSGFQANLWQIEAAKLLINNHADVNEPDEYGMTPIWGAVRQKNLPAIRLLMNCGADADALIANTDQSVKQWVEAKLAETQKRSEQQFFAEVLSLLTGQIVKPPEQPRLPEAFQKENERFRLALQARQMLSQLPERVNVTPADESELRSRERFEQLGEALEALGFVRQGQYIDDFGTAKGIVAYVHSTKKLDAVVQDYWWIDFVGCQILAYGEDRHLFACSNSNLKSADEPVLNFLTALEFPDEEPARLVDEIQTLIRKRNVKLIDNPADDFAKRYTSGYARLLSETKICLEMRLADDQILINGEPPLFERRGIFLDFSSWDDPSHTSATMAQRCLSRLLNNTANQSFSEGDVRDAFDLLAMQRLQFAGAPDDDTFLDQGCKSAAILFENLKSKWKNDLSFDRTSEVWMGLLMCQIAAARENNERPEFGQICNAVQPRMATEALRSHGDLPLPLGEWTILFVSRFRNRAVPKLEQWRDKVAKSQNNRAKHLLRAMDAQEAQQGDTFLRHLTAAIEEFKSSSARTGSEELHEQFALPESLLWNTAIQNRMQVHLELPLIDYLLTDSNSDTHERNALGSDRQYSL